jgi:hypothetical protein
MKEGVDTRDEALRLEARRGNDSRQFNYELLCLIRKKTARESK